jgi:hypothetical protein
MDVQQYPPPVLFLDFDGVTHPEMCQAHQLFTCLPLIEAVLREHPCVDVVISSSWREHHPLDELRAVFSRDIAPRIKGVTPIEPRRREMPAAAHVRERECRTWLQRNVPTGSWVAIDDVPWLFTPGCPHLILTNHRTGFSPSNADHLHAVLKRLSS